MTFIEALTTLFLALLVLGLPFITLFAGLLIVTFLSFFIDMALYKDVLHFTRNRLFRAVIKESHYKSVEGLVDALLATKKEDWVCEENRMVYRLDDIYSVQFSNSSIKKVSFHYKLVETSYISFKNDILSFSSIKEKPNQNLSKELFKHLGSIYSTLYKEKETLTKEEKIKREKEAEDEKQMEIRREKAEILKSILTHRHHPSLVETHSLDQGSFKIVFSNFENYQECLFYYEDKLYVEATNNKQKQNLTFDFKYTKGVNIEIFRQAEREIFTYVQNLFKEAEGIQEEQENELISM